ncbi:MAG: AAA family ATPase, partial [Gammaproteobacteria bacterium]|nr:ATP-binding protein [Gemmatimonadota bacterium]NIR38164.1 ATP-binding protein [Actinomycetota bacterium]NIU76152.1 AAA family ATPase [Gammaproteobacteria bacterium]NIY10011.1 AAA family ATPase [Gemmatimonadota bacterium]
KTRGLEGLSSPLVGRDQELEALRGVLRQLVGGRGGVVALVGGAGIGKSRLVAELRSEAAVAGVGWFEGRALSYGQSLAYHPWQQLGRQMIGATSAEGGAAVRDRLREFARGLGLS